MEVMVVDACGLTMRWWWWPMSSMQGVADNGAVVVVMVDIGSGCALDLCLSLSRW